MQQAVMMQVNKKLIVSLLVSLLFGAVSATRGETPSVGACTIKNICRLKGQEENTLQGIGIVVGLKGTGDGGNFLPTLRSLEKIMKVMGDPTNMKEIKDTKNVAIVTITATVPAAGARQGDKIDCVVSSIGSCKSLAGGRLFLTAMIGPDPKNPQVFAMSEGPITIDDASIPNTGRVFQGCRLEEDFMNVYVRDNKITLVLDKYHADFQVAQSVSEEIEAQLNFQATSGPMARAINQVNIEVTIPREYADNPVQFVSQVLAVKIHEPKTTPRVVINERSGSIVISGDVEIGSVAVTHKNVVIETAMAPQSGRFVGVDPVDPKAPKLEALVTALNALHVATPDIIDIIKGLDKNGKLYGQLVIE